MSKLRELAIKFRRELISFLVGFVFGLIACPDAEAASGNLSYRHPTMRADGSPLSASEIASYSILCTFTPAGAASSPCSGLSPSSFLGSAVGGIVSFSASQDGRACFSLVTVDTAGRQSVPSEQSCKDIAIAPPNPPGSVVVAFNVTISGERVQVEMVPAFGVLSSGARSSTVYGFVRPGVPCTGPELFVYRGASYRRVPREHVGWWRTTPNDNAAAPCS